MTWPNSLQPGRIRFHPSRAFERKKVSPGGKTPFFLRRFMLIGTQTMTRHTKEAPARSVPQRAVKQATTMAKMLSYKAKWNLNSQSGKLLSSSGLETWANPNSSVAATLLPQTPEEIQMLVDLLMNEKPLEYDSTVNELPLGEWEVAGEGEP